MTKFTYPCEEAWARGEHTKPCAVGKCVINGVQYEPMNAGGIRNPCPLSGWQKEFEASIRKAEARDSDVSSEAQPVAAIDRQGT